MKIKLDHKSLIQICLYLCLFVIGLISNSKMVFCALFLAFSAFLIIKCRRSLLMFVSALLIGYSNYSIVVQRYMFPESLVINTNLFEYDLLSIRIMFVFMFCLLLFLELANSKYKVTTIKQNFFISNYSFSPENNAVILTLCAIALIAIWVFFFDFNMGS